MCTTWIPWHIYYGLQFTDTLPDIGCTWHFLNGARLGYSLGKVGRWFFFSMGGRRNLKITFPKENKSNWLSSKPPSLRSNRFRGCCFLGLVQQTQGGWFHHEFCSDRRLKSLLRCLASGWMDSSFRYLWNVMLSVMLCILFLLVLCILLLVYSFGSSYRNHCWVHPTKSMKRKGNPIEILEFVLYKRLAV